MAASRVTKIYERHVRPLSPAERLLLLEMVARDLAAQPGLATPGLKLSIMELHGLGKEIWAGVDGQEYVNRLRDEWDRQA